MYQSTGVPYENTVNFIDKHVFLVWKGMQNQDAGLFDLQITEYIDLRDSIHILPFSI